MLMAGIQFTAGEHEFQLFHQQRKGLAQMVCIRVAEPASDTGTVGKVMQPVTLLHQTCPETRRHGARQAPTRGGRDCRRDALSRAVCLTPIKSSQKSVKNGSMVAIIRLIRMPFLTQFRVTLISRTYGPKLSLRRSANTASTPGISCTSRPVYASVLPCQRYLPVQNGKRRDAGCCW
uniref:Uncharacterized protein n=1 Tax=Escherichia coli TaxID=562 RepID=Q8VR60_ECOLX|nr:unknown [Escherichia coli]